MKGRLIFAIVVALLLMVAQVVSEPVKAWQAQAVRYQEARRLMWTQFEIVAYGTKQARLAEAAEAAFAEIERLDRQLSHYAETSELTYLNRHAAREAVIVEKELFDLLQLAVDYSRASRGAFDVTVGPLMKAWGFFKGEGRLPTADELQKTMATVGYQHVRLNAKTRGVRFDRAGVEIDLGGIAKGYAVDKALEVLRQSGVSAALVTAGSSSIGAIGAPPVEGSAQGWRIEVSDPLLRERRVESLDLKDQSVSTSGCHEKTFELGGKTYCHIMDPRTGQPVEGMVSATILTRRGVDAEAFSKIVMVLGVEQAKELLQTRPDVRALLFHRRVDGSLGLTKLNF